MTRTAAIVCAAGVASTFMARAVREQISHTGLDWRIVPLALEQLSEQASDVSVVIVGHHLAAHFASVRDELAERDVPTHLLDHDDHASAARQAVAVLLAFNDDGVAASTTASQKDDTHG